MIRVEIDMMLAMQSPLQYCTRTRKSVADLHVVFVSVTSPIPTFHQPEWKFCLPASIYWKLYIAHSLPLKLFWIQEHDIKEHVVLLAKLFLLSYTRTGTTFNLRNLLHSNRRSQKSATIVITSSVIPSFYRLTVANKKFLPTSSTIYCR